MILCVFGGLADTPLALVTEALRLQAGTSEFLGFVPRPFLRSLPAPPEDFPLAHYAPVWKDIVALFRYIDCFPQTSCYLLSLASLLFCSMISINEGLCSSGFLNLADPPFQGDTIVLLLFPKIMRSSACLL